MDLTSTVCPYCQGIQIQGVQTQSNYLWREVVIHALGDMPGIAKPIKAIEIYCVNCHRTLSITPLLN